ncbi:MAG: hypothetical protein ACKV0T_13730, partial [Planctomycetales bacterium]
TLEQPGIGHHKTCDQNLNAPRRPRHKPRFSAKNATAEWDCTRLGMQAIHELGHVLGGVATGGRVARVVLHPLGISRTDWQENPRPLIVTWAGPFFGVLAPTLLWGVAAARRCSESFLVRFFSGFCLVANGLYLGVGAWFRIGDCGDLLAHGARMSQLLAFGAVTVPAGFWMWNGQGHSFGWGAANGQVSRRAVWVSCLATGALLILGFAVG